MQDATTAAVVRLFSDTITSHCEPDGDLDLTQTEVILDGDDLVGLDVDFSDGEEDGTINSDEETSSRSDGDLNDLRQAEIDEETRNDGERENEKTILPSIRMAIKSSVDLVITSDSDSMLNFHIIH